MKRKLASHTSPESAVKRLKNGDVAPVCALLRSEVPLSPELREMIASRLEGSMKFPPGTKPLEYSSRGLRLLNAFTLSRMSASINVELARLRKNAMSKGLPFDTDVVGAELLRDKYRHATQGESLSSFRNLVSKKTSGTRWAARSKRK